MNHGLDWKCEFETSRLAVGEWHSAAQQRAVDLVRAISEMLTEATTLGLPDAWRGGLSVERAEAWIGERDRESPTLLIIEKQTKQPVGLVMLFAVPTDDGADVDLRIGYLFGERAWGRGLATELVAGVADWARSRRSIRTLTGGVAPTNPASARVLVKNGFERVEESDDDGEVTYRLSVDDGTEWDRSPWLDPRQHVDRDPRASSGL